MGKIKNMSLKKYFFLTIVVYLVAALIMSVLCYQLSSKAIDELGLYRVISPEDVDSFLDSVGSQYDQNLAYEIKGSGTTQVFYYKVQPWYNVFTFLSYAGPIVIFIAALLLADLTFYNKKLKKPIGILTSSTERIQKQTLDFQIPECGTDELGQLCAAFETMRQALLENNREMWRQAEERKRLNSAFAHDLRTPLTVLKGQSDMLIKYSPGMSAEKISEAADMMKRHIERMERYVETMNSVQRLEDIEISKAVISINEVCDPLRITGASVCGNKEFICDVSISEEQDIRIDLAAVMQVCENLLGNAGRYAKSKISLSIGIHNNYFIIEIADDGKGFSAEELLCAANPFYKSSEKTDKEHLGMGLYICKILCEKHGGYLKLKNDNGATITAAFQM